MLNRNPKTFTEMAQGWGRLVESTAPAHKVNAANGRQGLLIESKLGVDGQYYGILKENDGYYIKTASAQGGVPAADDYAYIGGEANRFRECFASLPKAQHRVHLKLHSLNESAPVRAQHVDELLTQLDSIPEAPVAVEVAPAPEAGLAAELAPEAGLEGAPLEAGLEGEPAVDAAPAPEGDSEEMTPDKILSLVGKLGAALDKLGAQNLTSQLTKAVIKPMLTHAAAGIRQLTDADKTEITDQIDGDGSAEAGAESMPAPEGDQPLEEGGMNSNARAQEIRRNSSAPTRSMEAVMNHNLRGQAAMYQDAAGEARREAVAQTFNRKFRIPAENADYRRQHLATAEHYVDTAAEKRNGAEDVIRGRDAEWRNVEGRKQYLPEEVDMLTGAEQGLAEAREEQDRQASYPGPKGHFHSDGDIEAMEREIEIKKHEVELAKWNQKKPVHPFEKEGEALNENLDNTYDSRNAEFKEDGARAQDSDNGQRAAYASRQNIAAANRKGGDFADAKQMLGTNSAIRNSETMAGFDGAAHHSDGDLNQSEPTGEFRRFLPEGDEDFNDASANLSGEDHSASEFADGFRSFCEYRGYDAYQDEDLAAALVAWAKVVTARNSPYDADIEGIADLINPFVLAQLKGRLPANFLASIEAETHALASEVAPLNEGLQALLRGLVAEQVEHLTEGLTPDQKERSLAHNGRKPLKVKGVVVHDGYGDSKTHNRPQYSHYVVADEKIHGGFESHSDAKDLANDMSEGGKSHKVYSGVHLKGKLAMDPNDNDHWAK